MGLMEREIQELRAMISRVDQGTIKPEEVSQKIAIYSQIEKRANLMVKVATIAGKYGMKKTIGDIANSDLVGGQIILDNNINHQVIVCPDTEKAITREQCLDYSGSAEHYESCKSCENFNVTRKLLCKEEGQ